MPLVYQHVLISAEHKHQLTVDSIQNAYDRDMFQELLFKTTAKGWMKRRGKASYRTTTIVWSPITRVRVKCACTMITSQSLGNLH